LRFVRDRFLGAADSDCGGRVSLQIKSLVLDATVSDCSARGKLQITSLILARETKLVDLTNLAGVNSLSD
jgi:hypothetical protein